VLGTVKLRPPDVHGVLHAGQYFLSLNALVHAIRKLLITPELLLTRSLQRGTVELSVKALSACVLPCTTVPTLALVVRTPASRPWNMGPAVNRLSR